MLIPSTQDLNIPKELLNINLYIQLSALKMIELAAVTGNVVVRKQTEF